MLYMKNDPMMLSLNNTDLKGNGGCVRAIIHFGAMNGVKLDWKVKEISDEKEFDELANQIGKRQ